MSADAISPQVASNSVPRAKPDSVQLQSAAASRALSSEVSKRSSVEAHQREAIRETQASVQEEVGRATEDLNRIMEAFDRGLRFKVHQETERTYVQVINRSTDEVIREWPSEELLDVVAKLHDAIGMLIDRKG